MIIAQDENKFYNAVNLIAGGDYFKIKRWRETEASWQEVWERHRAAAIDPERQWEQLAASGISLRLADDRLFPTLLREIPHPPFGLYLKGELNTADWSAIAIVGTRRAAPAGKTVAEKLAAALAAHRITIVSGLAFGIDAAAHRGALAAGGRTVGVLACGLDRVYPEEHAGLAEKILQAGGALVSEYPIGALTFPVRFLERNRIISGLSRGTVVVEAPVRSGALATARFAVEQNRDVFVVPGAVNNKNYEGSLELLKQGAALVTCADDILNAFPDWQTTAPLLPAAAGGARPPLADPAEEKIFAALEIAVAPLSLDGLTEISKLELHLVTRALTALVIREVVRENNGKYYI